MIDPGLDNDRDFYISVPNMEDGVWVVVHLTDGRLVETGKELSSERTGPLSSSGEEARGRPRVP